MEFFQMLFKVKICTGEDDVLVWRSNSNGHLMVKSCYEMNGDGYPGDYVKVAVLADPQLTDKTSHGLAPKSFALEIVQFYTDLFMRRAFLASILPFNPDVILVLGDYFDGGPILSDGEWQESLTRFKHIFHLNTRGRNRNVQVYFLSGNHDIGYASLHSHRPEVIKRYENEFGIRNYRFTIGKVEFIAVDAQTLDVGGPLEENVIVVGPPKGHAMVCGGSVEGHAIVELSAAWALGQRTLDKGYDYKGNMNFSDNDGCF
ncbi:hypothetical protein L1049_003677 [Liquidambar formosana]|uniref:Calcineurin-like phosphoesterase domain-containing protein n=1 Tax=Liquidambar formosana TaxID=63359 RepID=A0AAP0RMV4_LIQFO